MKKTDVVALGTLNIDIIIIGEAPRNFKALNRWVAPSRVEITPAGSVGYTALDLARLGLRVSLLSHLGDDALGKFIKAGLESEGVDTRAVTVEKNTASGIGVYMLLFGNRKRPLTGRLATHGPWPKKLSGAQLEKLKSARLLHCGGYLHYPDRWGKPTEEIYRAAKKFGLLTSLDPQFPFGPAKKPWLRHFGNLLEYVDIIFTDETEAKEITGEKTLEKCAEKLLNQGPRLAIIKQGAQGALFSLDNHVLFQPAFKVKNLTDSIGAGDAFDAGVIYGVLQGWPLKRTAAFASAVAAHTLKGMGGTQTAPTLRQALKLLTTKSQRPGKI